MTDPKRMLDALHAAQTALELIASPARPDGTYNRDRRACELLARETLKKVTDLLNPQDESPAPALPAAPTAIVRGVDDGRGYVVYSDGACKGNPGPSAWGVVVLKGDVEEFAGGGFLGHATNQVAELQAAIEALARVPEGARVTLVSDSQYTLKGLTEWRAGWERKGWRTTTGPVANLDYWKKLFALYDKRKVSVRWVKGHSGDVMNERCDALANKAIVARNALVLE